MCLTSGCTVGLALIGSLSVTVLLAAGRLRPGEDSVTVLSRARSVSRVFIALHVQ